MSQSSMKGFNEVKNRLAKEVQDLKTKSMRGIIQAEIFIRRDMEQTPPLIPVRTGNLRASWFTSNFWRDNNPLGVFGFSANYALFVHENMNADFKSARIKYDRKKKTAKITKRRPGAGPKFLEACLNRNHDKILKLISNEMTIP